MSIGLNTAVHAYFSVVIPEYLKGTCPSSHYGLFYQMMYEGKRANQCSGNRNSSVVLVVLTLD